MQVTWSAAEDLSKDETACSKHPRVSLDGVRSPPCHTMDRPKVYVYLTRRAAPHLAAVFHQLCAAPRRGWMSVVTLVRVHSPQQAHILVRLCSEARLHRAFARMGRLDLLHMSATLTKPLDDAAPSVVALNAARWKNGPDGTVVVCDAQGRVLSQTTQHAAWLEAYRTYLLNHELGHALGLRHHPPEAVGHQTVCSVMTQQTRTTHGGRFNAWPLASDIMRLQQHLQSG